MNTSHAQESAALQPPTFSHEHHEWTTSAVSYLVLLTEGTRGLGLLCALLAAGLIVALLGRAQQSRQISLLGLVLIVAGILVFVIRAMTVRFQGSL